jgi:hypothetical protein
MGLPQKTRDAIASEVENRFDFLFKQLNAVNKKDLVDRYARKPSFTDSHDVNARPHAKPLPNT